MPLQTGDPEQALTGLQLDVGTLVGIALTLLGAYVLARLLTGALGYLSEQTAEHRITVKMLIPVAKFLVYGGAAYYVLGPLLQLSSTQLLAVSGLIGAAIGFGLQDIFASVVGGLVIISEKPYQVGDKVEVKDSYGEVTGIGLRATRLVTADDTTVVVPNDAVFVDAVANANSGNPEMMVVVELHVANDADHERAAAILEEAIVTSRYLYVTENRPVSIRIDDGPFYRTIRGKAYVNDLRNEFAFESDVTRRALAAFDEAGIETPEVAVGADVE